MSLLGIDPVVGLLVKLQRPLTKENWLSLASVEEEDDAELMAEMPDELQELEDGEALPLQTYLDARAALPAEATSVTTLPSEQDEEDGPELGALRMARWRHQNKQLLGN